MMSNFNSLNKIRLYVFVFHRLEVRADRLLILFILRQSSWSDYTLANHTAIKQIFIIFSVVLFNFVLYSRLVSSNDPL